MGFVQYYINNQDELNAVIYYNIFDAKKAVLAVQRYDYAVSQLAQTTMRNIVGSVSLDELLSEREKIFDIIIENAIDYSIASASVEEIEEINILNAAMLAMKRAIDGLKNKPDLALIDGNCSRGFTVPTKTVVHGDAISQSIAAASILAKVTRDRLCYEYDKEYPEYGFAKHKGYGTKLHTDAIKAYGVTPIHRPSFLVKLFKND